MFILLPPSEGKSPGGRGKSLAQRGFDGPLGAARQATLASLHTLVDGDPAAAARALALPDGVVTEALTANRRVCRSATTAALQRYAGVVYDGLDQATLEPAEQRLARRRIYVFSGLLGVVRGDEAIPLYRVPAKAVLPGIGIAGTYWRPVLDEIMPSLLGQSLVIDLRSSDYAAMWRPSRDLAERVITVRVLSRTPRGQHAVISYNSKLGKGKLARALVRRCTAGQEVASAEDVLTGWAEAGGIDGQAHGRGGRTTLDLYEN